MKQLKDLKAAFEDPRWRELVREQGLTALPGTTRLLSCRPPCARPGRDAGHRIRASHCRPLAEAFRTWLAGHDD